MDGQRRVEYLSLAMLLKNTYFSDLPFHSFKRMKMMNHYTPNLL